MTFIKAIEIDETLAKTWIAENIKDLSVDSISAVYPTKYNEDGSIKLYDDEEGISKTFTVDQQVEGLKKLALEIDGKRLFVGGLTRSLDLEDACNWDVEVADAFFQLIYHGEVIYG